MTDAERVRYAFVESARTSLGTARRYTDIILAMAQRIADVQLAGGTLLLCGNGGSAADAQHWAAEWLVRLRPTVDRAPFRALALALDPSTLTASANDYGYEQHYARMVQAWGRPGDLLLGVSTSGRSENIVHAFRVARSMGIGTIGFLGREGGAALAHCDLAVVVPSHKTARIQETHGILGHVVLELAEDRILAHAA